MSTPSGTVFKFPTSGTDYFYPKYGIGDSIPTEFYTIPGSAQVTLQHNPTFGTETVFASGFGFYVRATGIPMSAQYNIVYSGANAGLITFNTANTGTAVSINYSGADVMQASFINELQQSVSGTQAYTLSLNSKFIAASGGTMSGNLTLLNANILTATPSGGNIGSPAAPIANVYSVSETIQTIVSQDGLSQINLSNGVSISSSKQITISSPSGTKSSGSIVPTTNNAFDLGSSGSRWNTAYVNRLDANYINGFDPNNFVKKTGDIISGNITFAGANVLTANNIQGTSINVSSSDLTISTSNQVNINNSLGADSFGVYINQTAVPNGSGTVDLGTSSNPFGKIYADAIIGADMSGNYVRLTGDQMSGDLIIPGPAQLQVNTITASQPGSGTTDIDINARQINQNITSNLNVVVNGATKLEVGLNGIYVSDGVYPSSGHIIDLGAYDAPYKSVYADNISGTFNGTLSGTIGVSSGTTIGSSGSPITTIFATSIVVPGVSGTGVYVQRVGDSMVGNLTMINSNILASGTVNIGDSGTPIDTIYVNNIVSASGAGTFVSKSGDIMSGSLIITDASGLTTPKVSGAAILTIEANQVNMSSLNGPIVLDANTELQILNNGSPLMAISSSEIKPYENIVPYTGHAIDLGSSLNTFRALYVDSIVGLTGLTIPSGTYVRVIGDSMTGSLHMASGSSIDVGDLNSYDTSSTNIIAIGDSNTITGSSFNSLSVGTSNILDISRETIVGGMLNLALNSSQSQLFGVSNKLISAPWATMFGINNSGTSSLGFTAGTKNINNATNSIIFGYSGISNGEASFQAGSFNQTFGQNSISLGGNNISSGTHSVSMGAGNQALGDYSIAGGVVSIAQGTESLAIGGAVQALASYSAAINKQTIAKGQSSFAANQQTTAAGYASSAFGLNSVSSGNATFVAGINGQALHDASFVFSDGQPADTTGIGQFIVGAAGGLIVTSGTSILPQVSGASNLGSSGNHFNTLYVDNIAGVTTVLNVITVSGTYAVTSANDVMLCNTSVNPVQINVPVLSSGKLLRIKDKSNNAGINNIVVSGIGCTIDLVSTSTIASNLGKLTLLSDGSNYFIVE
jgi:hypothetical protein